MATNQTEHYKLNQWELTDSVVMAEFNADNAKLEQALLDLKASLPKFQSGSYVGTGAYGADNPTTLTFDFEPQVLIIVPQPVGTNNQQSITKAESVCTLVAIRGAAAAPVSYDCNQYGGNFEPAIVNLAWDGDTVSLYHNYYGFLQYNASDLTYRYLAIG